MVVRSYPTFWVMVVAPSEWVEMPTHLLTCLRKLARPFQAHAKRQWCCFKPIFRHSAGSPPLKCFMTSPFAESRNRTDQIAAMNIGDRNFLEFSKGAEADNWDFAVIPDFISSEDEQSLMNDISRSFRGKKYQFDHWDGVSYKHPLTG